MPGVGSGVILRTFKNGVKSRRLDNQHGSKYADKISTMLIFFRHFFSTVDASRQPVIACAISGPHLRLNASENRHRSKMGIDQILVRALALERGPEPWPDERRRVTAGVLSDHAPVEAVVVSTS